jgi:glycosyltransferase involved in cell wall biosynthesis
VRILIFCPAIGTESGSGIRSRLIVEGLPRCGDDVCVVAWKVPPGLGEPRASVQLLGEGEPVEAGIARAARSFRPDIVYGITEAEASAVAGAAKTLGIPVAFDIHGLGFVEVLELGKGHGPRYPRVKKSLRWLARIPFAAAVTAANPRLVPVLRRLNRRTEPVVGMTDVGRFRPEGESARLGSGKGRVQVLYAGNYYRWQGVPLLMEAIGRLLDDGEPFEFTLVGTVGRDPDRLERWKSRFPAEQVRFLDAVEYARVAEYYRGADVTVLPRPFLFTTYLAFPQKLVDSMASGRAVVATDIAPHRFALRSPEAGVLCAATPGGLAEGIRRTKDGPFRERLSETARREAVARFCHLKQTGRIHDLFRSVLGGA